MDYPLFKETEFPNTLSIYMLSLYYESREAS